MKQTTLGVGEIDLADWHLLLGALRSRFEAESFAEGAAFVAAIGRLAGETGHHPDVDLRAGHVQFALRSRDAGGVTERDVRLAERISALAAEHGLTPRPERAQVLELALDTPGSDTVRGFWAAVLAGRAAGGEVTSREVTGGEVTGSAVATPDAELLPLGLDKLWFQRTDSTAPDRQRFHVDVTVPPSDADRRVAAAIDAGGRVVDDSHAPAFVVLSDPDGNKACICTELGRD
ncbi:VOC family protein [Prauserella halophila]|uniref:Putative pterin-4-alpha-carbinolamine dehydratase n=1 Tax=Prauserella halophila TaxID=185641 RepID=A0ABN1WG08_9PSEU|nr:VOC family protein [Prauserella halophila]MCP2236906.1 4a-hydroxytetrahydrobiopterin dehydratase [Prauserella halophila]